MELLPLLLILVAGAFLILVVCAVVSAAKTSRESSLHRSDTGADFSGDTSTGFPDSNSSDGLPQAHHAHDHGSHDHSHDGGSFDGGGSDGGGFDGGGGCDAGGGDCGGGGSSD